MQSFPEIEKFKFRLGSVISGKHYHFPTVTNPFYAQNTVQL